LIKQVNPEIKTELRYVLTLYKPWIYAKRMGIEAIHPLYYNISSNIIDCCHKNSIIVNVWTVNDKRAIEQMIANQVDTIITNYPETALELHNNLNKR